MGKSSEELDRKAQYKPDTKVFEGVGSEVFGRISHL